MALPTYAQLMLPLLRLASDDRTHKNNDTVSDLAEQFALTDTERHELVPSQSERTFDNRVRWAKVHLRKAGLLDIPASGLIMITQRGHDLLRTNPVSISADTLKQYPEYVKWLEQSNSNKLQSTSDDPMPTNDADSGPLRFCLAKTMADYMAVKSAPQKGHDFAIWFRGLKTSLPIVINELEDFVTDCSVGHSGNWSSVPWITIRRPDLAPKVTSGIYVAYLFRSDMSEVYLSLNQGVSDISSAASSKLSTLRARAVTLRSMIDVPDNLRATKIDLKPGTALGENYEAAHIWGLKYTADDLPAESTLRADLRALLAVYSTIDPSTINFEPNTAVFSSPFIHPSDLDAQPENYSFEQLVTDSLWPRTALEKILKVLSPLDPNKAPRQIILSGPPGTGKTWLAKLLVKFVTKNVTSRARLIQFHPSYGYEQFIEGLQPTVEDGAISFSIVPGIVRVLASSCAADTNKHFLIIDEINRANLPRVFGELMYLLEYRDETVFLPFSGSFRLPSNLSFIGTMNSADRSIRSIDLALRRRFEIFQCPADAGILERYYAPETGRVNEVRDLLEGFVALNEFLKNALDRYHAIGQTFFMANNFSEDDLRAVWDRQIAPTLEEYFFDDPGQLDNIGLERFWSSLKK